MSAQLAHKIIDDLYDKYNENEYMTLKMNTYICEQLSGVFHGRRLFGLEFKCSWYLYSS